jgi:hypothetical protein
VKYIAILRDSFREAVDSKVLYATGTLTALLLLLVGSVSLKPLTMQEEVEARASQLTTIFGLQGRSAGVNATCEVEDFQRLNDAAEPWNGAYRFTYVISLSEPVPDLARLPFTRVLQETVPGFLWRFNDVCVTTLQPRNKQEFRMGVSIRGSKVERARDWNHVPVLFFGALPVPWLMNSPTYMVYFIEDWVVNWLLGWVIVLLGVVVTASFIPTMLRKGSVDLLLSKPISRARLLVFKYLGGLTFVFLNAALIMVGVYVLLGLRSGIWANGILLSILLLTFFFAILYAISTLTAVLTESTVLCILFACLAWFVLFLVGKLHDWVSPAGGSNPDVPAWASTTVNVLHTVLPRTRDLGQLTTRLLSGELLSEAEQHQRGLDEPVGSTWNEAVGVSTAFIVVLLGFSCWRLSRRDY